MGMANYQSLPWVRSLNKYFLKEQGVNDCLYALVRSQPSDDDARSMRACLNNMEDRLDKKIDDKMDELYRVLLANKVIQNKTAQPSQSSSGKRTCHASGNEDTSAMTSSGRYTGNAKVGNVGEARDKDAGHPLAPEHFDGVTPHQIK